MIPTFQVISCFNPFNISVLHSTNSSEMNYCKYLKMLHFHEICDQIKLNTSSFLDVSM